MHDSLTPATATIDAGRLLTIERRRHFSGLSLQLVDIETGEDRIIDCLSNPLGAGVLSERRIARAIMSLLAGFDTPEDLEWIGACVGILASGIQGAMRDWSNAGYPRMDEGEIERFEFRTLDIVATLRHSL